MKRLGIWGLGVVGQSVARYCLTRAIPFTVLNDRPLAPEQQDFLAEHSLTCETDIESFLAHHNQILVSAGIDLRPYLNYAHKFIGELDFFAREWHKPIIAITGTVGKTTVTHVLGNLLNHFGKKTVIGGNIGVGLCDLLSQDAEYAALEVSSFQLEVSNHFAADLAIWTNFSPNHLDRHNSLAEYRAAKNKLITMQHAGQKALVPFSLRDEIQKGASTLFYFVDKNLCNAIEDTQSLFFLDITYQPRYATTIDSTIAPKTLLRENWLIIASALHLLGLGDRLQEAAEFIDTLAKPAHRLEYITTINGVAFYNDSKATTPAATTAALNQFNDKPIILIVGGVSKGIDRAEFMQSLPMHVSRVICFGSEAQELAAHCNRPAVICATLEDVIQITHEKSTPGEIVLFSPAGASFDLFSNYVERGEHFKKLIIDCCDSIGNIYSRNL